MCIDAQTSYLEPYEKGGDQLLFHSLSWYPSGKNSNRCPDHQRVGERRLATVVLKNLKDSY